jgi:transcriptional regulator with XRE-family HTH domain
VRYNANYAKHAKVVIPQELLSMDIVKQLEAYRLENRVTQVVLAKEIGVNFSTVSRWLNGKTKPNKIQQYHIEKFLKKLH